jgi:hypothetical protein
MTRRLRILMAVLAALGVLTVVDRPQANLPEVSEGVERTSGVPATGGSAAGQPEHGLAAAVVGQAQGTGMERRAPAGGGQARMAGAVEDEDAINAPVPDLFAAAGSQANTAGAQEKAAGTDGAGEDAPPKPFVLLGFKQEDSMREAYLLRNGDVVTTRAGAVLEQRYRVLALGEDAVHIKDNTSGATLRVGFEDHP